MSKMLIIDLVWLIWVNVYCIINRIHRVMNFGEFTLFGRQSAHLFPALPCHANWQCCGTNRWPTVMRRWVASPWCPSLNTATCRLLTFIKLSLTLRKLSTSASCNGTWLTVRGVGFIRVRQRWALALPLVLLRYQGTTKPPTQYRGNVKIFIVMHYQQCTKKLALLPALS